MNILFIGNSEIFRKKILPFLKKKKIFNCEIASKKKINDNFFSRKYDNYDYAIKNTKAKLVYVSLINSLHYKFCKKSLMQKKHVIVDKPLTLKSKKNFELIKIAKENNLLLAEASVFSFNKRFKKFYSLIDFDKKIKIEVFFSIPQLDKKNFRNFKSKGGGCYNDMSSYLINCIYLFYKKEFNNFNLKKKIKDQLINNFSLTIKEKNYSFNGKFSFNSKYKNYIKIINNNNKLFYPMAFSQPLNKETFFIHNNTKNYYKFENSFISFLINIKRLIKNKKYFAHYKNLTIATRIREKIEKKI